MTVLLSLACDIARELAFGDIARPLSYFDASTTLTHTIQGLVQTDDANDNQSGEVQIISGTAFISKASIPMPEERDRITDADGFLWYVAGIKADAGVLWEIQIVRDFRAGVRP